jgi:hypothetical protein
VVRPGDAIHFAAADIDEPTAQAVRAAMTAGDPSRALAVFLAAQSLPDKLEANPIAASPKLQATLARPDTRFVRVYLFDSCINDGDVMALYLDDELIAIVPLTNAGATLTLPVPASGRARIVLRGNVDGGGGITVGCRTSLGDFFCRPMTTGEVQPVGIIGD